VEETRRNASPDVCHAASAAHDRLAISCAPCSATFGHNRFLAHSVIALAGSRAPWTRGRNRQHSPWGALRTTGFTIIELMIVVVIVAILAMIAYPSYEDHMRKGRRSAAQNFLADIATRQQQYLLDARQYAVGAGALGALNMTVPTEVVPFYAVTINPAAPTVPPSYTLMATPLPGSRQVPDGALTLDSSGAKTRNGQPGWQ
jgi:type IV pilus assembly protein PilE